MTPASEFFEGCKTQARCPRALIICDMMVRYGRETIGFLWFILEPILLTGGVMLLWTLIRTNAGHGVQLVSFVMTGYIPLTVWRHITNSRVFIFRHRAATFYHRKISLIDALIARLALEFVGTTCALVIVYTILYLAGIMPPIYDPGLVAGGWILMALLSCGVAVVFAVMIEWSETFVRFIQLAQYLMIPISGCFFLVDWLPTYAQKQVWFNPTTHCYEMFRAGFFGDKVHMYYAPRYVLLCTLILAFIGRSSLEKIRDAFTSLGGPTLSRALCDIRPH